MQTPPVLLLDVLGTLVHDPFFVEMPAFFGLSLRELIAQKHPTTWLDFEHGAIDETTVAERFFADGRPVDLPAFKEHVRRAYRLLPGMEDLLDELRDAGVAMHALSNYSTWWELIEEQVRLSRWLTWSFVSCKTGLRKPHVDAYVHAAHRLGVPASACVFVDDRPENVAAAEAVGMRGFVFHDAPRLRSDLASVGLV